MYIHISQNATHDRLSIRADRSTSPQRHKENSENSTKKGKTKSGENDSKRCMTLHDPYVLG